MSETKENTRRNGHTYKRYRSNNRSNKKFNKQRFSSYRQEMKEYINTKYEQIHIPCSKTGRKRTIEQSPKDCGRCGKSEIKVVLEREMKDFAVIIGKFGYMRFIGGRRIACPYQIQENWVINGLKHRTRILSYQIS